MTTTKTPVAKPARHVITVSPERHAAVQFIAKNHGITAQEATDVLLEVGLNLNNADQFRDAVTSRKAARPLDKQIAELTKQQKARLAAYIASGLPNLEDE